MEDTSSDHNRIDKKSINSLIRKSEGLKKILKKAEFVDIEQQLIQLDSKFDEIETRMSDPLSDY
ncbi:MAG: hypothetical protein ACPG8U_00625 [Candidatus Thalassarchaeaceae archaeon]|tara:strand:- start:431 stop:622 length:192 start_codon:yes stop_codon:yes gene_type:complete